MTGEDAENALLDQTGEELCAGLRVCAEKVGFKVVGLGGEPRTCLSSESFAGLPVVGPVGERERSCALPGNRDDLDGRSVGRSVGRPLPGAAPRAPERPTNRRELALVEGKVVDLPGWKLVAVMGLAPTTSTLRTSSGQSRDLALHAKSQVSGQTPDQK